MVKRREAWFDSQLDLDTSRLVFIDETRRLTDAALVGGRKSAVIKIGELVLILELHRQGVSVSAISHQLGTERPSALTSPKGLNRRPINDAR